MEWPWRPDIPIYPTFDTERNWHAREVPYERQEKLRGPNFPKESEPNYDMDQRAIPKLLRLFDEHDVKCLFFVTGEFCEYNPDLVIDIESAGHELGVHTHPQLHPEFRGDHINDLKYGYLEDYPPDEIRSMIQRDYEKLREVGVDTVHFRAGNLSITKTVAEQVKRVGLKHDHSLRMVNLKDLSNVPLYFEIRRLGLKETPVVLNPAYIHEQEHNQLKPYHWLYSTLFGGTLNLHPMVFGNDVLSLDDDWRRLEQYAKRCSHRLSNGTTMER